MFRCRFLPSWFLPFCYLLTWVVPDKFQKSSKTIVCVVGLHFATSPRTQLCWAWLVHSRCVSSSTQSMQQSLSLSW